VRKLILDGSEEFESDLSDLEKQEYHNNALNTGPTNL
jgi:hypothetical protein